MRRWRPRRPRRNRRTFDRHGSCDDPSQTASGPPHAFVSVPQERERVAAPRGIEVARDAGLVHLRGALTLHRELLDALANRREHVAQRDIDRKSTRLNSSHVKISYAVFCLKKKKNQ